MNLKQIIFKLEIYPIDIALRLDIHIFRQKPTKPDLREVMR